MHAPWTASLGNSFTPRHSEWTASLANVQHAHTCNSADYHGLCARYNTAAQISNAAGPTSSTVKKTWSLWKMPLGSFVRTPAHDTTLHRDRHLLSPAQHGRSLANFQRLLLVERDTALIWTTEGSNVHLACKEPDGAGLAGPPAVSANARPLVPLARHCSPKVSRACSTAHCSSASATGNPAATVYLSSASRPKVLSVHMLMCPAAVAG